MIELTSECVGEEFGGVCEEEKDGGGSDEAASVGFEWQEVVGDDGPGGVSECGADAGEESCDPASRGFGQ